MSAARRMLVAALLVGLAVATGASEAALERQAQADPGAELLYLPNGKYLKLLSLGYDSVLADAIYLWSIQYYSNYERRDRYRYVEHVFDGVITELDPHFVDAYWIGALILTVEAREVDAGLRLLEKGIDNNPEQWILAYLAAWEAYHAGRFEQAGEYFARAAEIPGAPASVVRMRAGMRNKAGDIGGAIRLWQEIAEDPASDARSVAIAKRQLRQLNVKFDLARLHDAIGAFRTDNGRFPQTLEELSRRGYIASVPRDPSGEDYRYDPLDGSVAQPGSRVLDAR